MSKFSIFVSLIFLTFVSINTFAEVEISKYDKEKKREELQRINVKILKISSDIKRRKAILTEDVSISVRREHSRELRILKKKEKKTRDQFLEASGNISFSNVKQQTAEKKRDLVSEVQEILLPLVDGIRRASKRPREIEGLRYQIETTKENLELRRDALKRIGRYLNDQYFKNVQTGLEISKVFLKDNINETEIDLFAKERKLKDMLNNKLSVFDSVKNLLTSFFLKKGKNLFLALLTSILIIWGSVILRRKTIKIFQLHSGLIHLQKPFTALFNLASFIFATLGALLCLYVLHDWLLVTLLVIAIVGFAWSLKQFIPQFIDETRLILNLGPVREGERIILKGIPWKVEKLGLYSKLKNECLEGDGIRVSSSVIIKEHSRPISVNEKWFPSCKGDWVLLQNGVYGKIIVQTPEYVEIEKHGGSKVYLAVGEYFGQNPENLSKGFRVEEILGLDYGIQENILKSTISLFQKRIEEEISHWENLRGMLHNIVVQFHSTGSSSLNIWVKVDCVGTAAPYREGIRRKIQEIFVQICNEESYVIPFEQLTIHSEKIK